MRGALTTGIALTAVLAAGMMASQARAAEEP